MYVFNTSNFSYCSTLREDKVCLRFKPAANVYLISFSIVVYLLEVCVYLFSFFFQAEDGIRDYKVTGVQTCALPICNNYLLNELGIALIYPNVRGSTGYGKTFSLLDNGFKRGDTYKDINALFDWIDRKSVV